MSIRHRHDREEALDRIENKRVKWCRVDGQFPKLDVAGSIPVSRSIFLITYEPA